MDHRDQLFVVLIAAEFSGQRLRQVSGDLVAMALVKAAEFGPAEKPDRTFNIGPHMIKQAPSQAAAAQCRVNEQAG